MKPTAIPLRPSHPVIPFRPRHWRWRAFKRWLNEFYLHRMLRRPMEIKAWSLTQQTVVAGGLPEPTTEEQRRFAEAMEAHALKLAMQLALSGERK